MRSIASTHRASVLGAPFYVMQRVEGWAPAHPATGIMRGDMGTPNALFAFEPPARLNALIDWELSTIGDPMLDLGWMCTGLRGERAPGRLSAKSRYNAANMPTRQELARYYCAGTGRDIGDLDYCVVLALFKGGCLLEYKVAQAAAGLQSEATGRMFSRLVAENFLEAAWLIDQMG
jgi:aminoglycoside phosphotransferase (APT) family kinase protein